MSLLYKEYNVLLRDIDEMGEGEAKTEMRMDASHS